MPPLPFPMQEAFAQAMAGGATPSKAYVAAGYKAHCGHGARQARRENVKARIEEIRWRATWGGSSDLAEVIDEMARLALSPPEHKSAAALMAAKGLLVEVAKLKRLLPEPPKAKVELRPILSREEWLRLYGAPS